MGTPFIAILEPHLFSWKRGLPLEEQKQKRDRSDQTFYDVMEVRQKVFVKERHLPFMARFDDDDLRAVHFVIYASVCKIVQKEVRHPRTDEITVPQRSETKSVPIGTVRLVPFPHERHPRNGAAYVGGELTKPVVSPAQSGPFRRYSTAWLVQVENDKPTAMHDGKEPYIMLDRLATLSEFRDAYPSWQLIKAAIKWMANNPNRFNLRVSQVGADNLRLEAGGDVPKWRGLFCVHAEESEAGLWDMFGFKRDPVMGTWTEEGVPHVGMFWRYKFDRVPHWAILNVRE